MSGLAPLSADEAALLYHVQMWGSTGYPVERLGRRWIVRDWRTVRAAPGVHPSKRAAVAAFELWLEVARLRWRETRAPLEILTAIGTRILSA